MPKISVIVPVYKVEKYIYRCLDSILAQTYRDFELILVDDGSPDNCGAICDAYAKRDPRIIVIHQENAGLSAARNAGLDWAFANSDSEWLSFIDSDDWVVPSYLADLYNAVQSPEVDVSMGCYVDVTGEYETSSDTGDHSVLQLSGREACHGLYSRDVEWVRMCPGNHIFVQSWNKLYRKSLFSGIRFPVGKINEDEGTTYKLLYHARKVAVVRKILYCYTINPDGIMHSKFTLNRFDGLDLIKEAELFFLENGEPEIAHLAYRERKRVQINLVLQARKSGLYRKVPKEYKMGNLLQQAKQMEKILGRDEYEYVMYSYYPKLVSFQCYLRKICQILGF